MSRRPSHVRGFKVYSGDDGQPAAKTALSAAISLLSPAQIQSVSNLLHGELGDAVGEKHAILLDACEDLDDVATDLLHLGRRS